MSVVEYNLVKREDGALGIPWWIKAGGYHMSPINHSMVGVAYEQREVEYGLPTLDPLTKSDLVNRQLDIHAVYPMKKLVDAKGNTIPRGSATDPGTLVDMTEEEVTIVTETWFDTFVVEQAPVNPTQAMLDDLKSERVNDAFNKMEVLLEDAYVDVPIASANTTFSFGCDQVTQENIMGINTAINGGIPIPDPTYWTPKGQIEPIQVTHNELKTIGGAILDKKNAYYQVYFTHKATIMNATDYNTLLLYDYAIGYDI